MELLSNLLIILSTCGLLIIPIIIEKIIIQEKDKLIDGEKNYNDFTVALDKSYQASKKYDEMNLLNVIYEKVCNGDPELDFIKDNISERLREAARTLAFWSKDSKKYTVELESLTDQEIQDKIDADLFEHGIEQKKIGCSITVLKKNIEKWEGWKRRILIFCAVLNISVILLKILF